MKTGLVRTLTDDDSQNGVLGDVAFVAELQDALALTRRGRIVRRFPLGLGLELAGTAALSPVIRVRGGRPRRPTARSGATMGRYNDRSASPRCIVHMPAGI